MLAKRFDQIKAQHELIITGSGEPYRCSCDQAAFGMSFRDASERFQRHLIESSLGQLLIEEGSLTKELLEPWQDTMGKIIDICNARPFHNSGHLLEIILLCRAIMEPKKRFSGEA